MPDALLAAAFAGGHVVVTPNNRLARALVAQHDADQRARGALTWPAAQVLPWSAWMQSLWQEALAADALTAPRALLEPAASVVLWERIVGSDHLLLDAKGAATAAAAAWSAFHGWRRPGETTVAWGHAGIDDDAAAFARWAARYAEMLEESQRLDMAQLPDALVEAASRTSAWAGRRWVLAGFLRWTPQQVRLLTALEDAGAELHRLDLPAPREAVLSRRVFTSTASELAAALGHARALAVADPAARIGIVVGNLGQRRASVVAAADDILCPEIAIQADPDAPRPYDLSLGTPLAEVPLVTTALRLVEWSAGALPMPLAAALLRSPYLPGDTASWRRRADAERIWREAGTLQVSMAAALAALPEGDPLIARWKSWRPPEPGRRSPAKWAELWRDRLEALGWPGAGPLGSSEWQARDAWWKLLGTWATLEPVTGRVTRDEALAALRTMATRSLFQPETRGAKIQILGSLEAAGLEFDALWLLGMSADRWPPAASPLALLPQRWQRERGVPGADARETLAFSRTLTASLARAAPEVVASHAEMEGGAQASVSSLVAHWPLRTDAPAPVYAGLLRDMAAARPAMQSQADAVAPEVESGSHARGGAAVVEHQSNCPFQAFARHRLRGEAWPDLVAGLSPAERGEILHRAFATFWKAVVTQARLLALDPVALETQLSTAVEAGLSAVDARRWRVVPAAVTAAERDRLANVMRAWLQTVEAARAPFTVEEREQLHTLSLGDLQFRLRLDRVDALDDAGRVVIDYKSGRATAPGKWFADRPEGTQVGLYALALQAEDTTREIRAAAFAQLRAGEVKALGIAADLQAWPGLKPANKILAKRGVEDWPGVMSLWHERYDALATDFRCGRAEVAPRNAEACRYCELKALCRVQRLDDPSDVAEGDDAGDDDQGEGHERA